MAPPAALVRTARLLWHQQWLLLMGGLGPADRQGHYRRPTAAFTDLPPLPADAGEDDAHVLIVGRSCPWAHRAWLCWQLRQLAPAIRLEIVEPDPQAGRWCFPRPFAGCRTLAELYRRSGAPPGSRATVPALWSQRQQRILLGESARLIEWLDQWPSPRAPLWPAEQRGTIDLWRERLQHTVNDGVYRCGFARNQAAYDAAEGALFASLSSVEEQLLRLEQAAAGQTAAGQADAVGIATAAGHATAPESTAAAGADERTATRSTTPAGSVPPAGNAAPDPTTSGPWLCGSSGPTLADVVLFPTLIRWEMVYAPLFGCSREPLWHYPALWRWRARLLALPGVAATCDAEAWRRDYFGALFPLHPSGIVPAGPALSTLVNSRPGP